MIDTTKETVAIHLPAELAMRMENLKNNRPKDRGKSLEDIVLGMCLGYVTVLEMAEEDAKNMEAIEESYRLHPDWYDDDFAKENDVPQVP